MNRPAVTTPAAEVSRIPASGGWHVAHTFYSWNRGALAEMTADRIAAGRDALSAALDPAHPEAPHRLQTWIVAGAKADFAVMALDPDPMKVDSLHQRIMASTLGAALMPSYSFVSLTEISEYVFTREQYAARLVAEGESEGSAAFKAKIRSYSDRLDAMNRQRLTPDFPPYTNCCFYPMNKKRKVGENWFLLPKEQRMNLMAEHAKSGMAFAGKVSQLISVGIGLEDWEWGVTLWAANPEYLKEIVYSMRFDEASARYAEFGPFYTGYVASSSELLDHCRIGRP